MSLLPHLPLDPAWIEQSEAFHHSDPRVAKAAIKLLFAAWRGLPAASIPASHSFIADASGLPSEVVAEHYVVLTSGFEIREDGRLHHVHLSHLCERMTSSYGKEIEAYGLAAAMAAQDPDQFSVVRVEASSKRPRGRVVTPGAAVPPIGAANANSFARQGRSAFSGLHRQSSMPQTKDESVSDRTVGVMSHAPAQRARK